MRPATLILAASLALPLTAQATEYCQGMAGWATAVAKDREAGASAADAKATAAREVSGEALGDMLAIVDSVYAYPRLTPDREGNRVYDICMEATGEPI